MHDLRVATAGQAALADSNLLVNIYDYLLEDKESIAAARLVESIFEDAIPHACLGL